MSDRLSRLRGSPFSTAISMDAFQSTHMHIGDVISLYALPLPRHQQTSSQNVVPKEQRRASIFAGAVEQTNGGTLPSRHEGFLSTLGLVDCRLIVEENNGTLQSPPKTFRDCLFRICPLYRYAAQKQYWAEQHKFQAGDTLDEEMLNKLRVAAEKEREQNEREYTKLFGSPIQYGSSVQLLHVRSDKYITTQKNSPARQERNAMRVYLDRLGNEGSWWCVEPVYKHVSIGDTVMSGERISLVPYHSKVPSLTPMHLSGGSSASKSALESVASQVNLQLHLSQQRLLDKTTAWEVNCLNEQTEWQVNIYLQHDETGDIIKSGDVVRLFHAEQQAFLTLDTEPSLQREVVFLRLTKRSSATEATSSRALWEIQVYNKEAAVRGGAATWRRFFRFKHLATEQYLTVANDNASMSQNASLRTDERMSNLSTTPPIILENDPIENASNGEVFVLVPIRSNDPSRDDNLLFALDPCTKTRDFLGKDSRVPVNSFVRLQHVCTGAWLHTTLPTLRHNLYFTSKNEKGWVKVVAEPLRIDKEAFALSSVPPSEVRDLDFANDACRALRHFIEMIKQGSTIGKEAINSASTLLVECIYFVTGIKSQSSTFLDPLRIADFKPTRDRQKLLREQKVLSQIFALLKTPFGPRKHASTGEELPPLLTSPQELSEQRNEVFRKMFQLCYALLRYSQVNYPKNQEFLAENFDQIQEQIGYNLTAEDTMTAVLHNNPNLLKKYVKMPHVERFVDLVRISRSGKFLNYLADLCVCRGEANKKVQELICNGVLSEHNRDIFMQTEMCPSIDRGRKFEVYISWNYPGATPQSLISCAESKSKEHQEMIDYYRHQLDLFAQMCQDQQYLAIDPPPERRLLNISKELPVDLVIQCISDTRLPSNIRASFCRLMVHLHVVRGSPVTAVRYARLWRDIPVEVNLSTYRNNALENSNNRGSNGHYDEFYKECLRIVDEYLRGLIKAREEKGEGPVLNSSAESCDENRLTFEIVNLARALAQFGFYSFPELLKLTQNLLTIVNASHTPRKNRKRLKSVNGSGIKDDSQAMPKEMKYGSSLTYQTNQITPPSPTTANLFFPIISTRGGSSISAENGNRRESADRQSNAEKQSVEMIVQTKLIVVDILQFVMCVRRDYRITVALSFFKNKFPCNENGELYSAPVLQRSLVEDMCATVLERTDAELDCDGSRGQRMLQILLQMTMSNHREVTSRALKVFFKHFTQYHELADDLKQVQLLVSHRDVDNYHKIDRDLYILKTLTEKSELWVHYGRSRHGTSDTGSTTSSPVNNVSQEARSRSFSGDEISLNLPELPTDLEEKQRQEELLRLKLSLELSSTATEQQQTSNSDERGNLSKKLRRQEESFEQITSEGDVDTELKCAAPLRYKSSHAQFLQRYYPQMKRRLVSLLSQLTNEDFDRAKTTDSLHKIMDKAPLLGYRLVRDILFRMKNLCFEDSKTDLMNQQLLRNMRVYEVVLNFMSVPYDKKTDVEMPKLITLSHKFLRSFCRNNRENQIRLHAFITTDADESTKEGMFQVRTVEDCLTISAIFRGNVELCESVSESLIKHVVKLIENKQRNAVFIEFLQVVISSCEKELENCQIKVVEELGKASDDVRQFYVDSASFEQLLEMMRTVKDIDITHPLRYHFELVKLLSQCTRGKNDVTELKCASFLPIDHIVRTMTSKECLIEAKEAYVQFLLNCYIDSSIEMKDSCNIDYMDSILENIISDISHLTHGLQIETKITPDLIALERYICQTVTDLLIKLFTKAVENRRFFGEKHCQRRFVALIQRLTELQNGPLKGTSHTKNWYKVAECNKRLVKSASKLGLLLPVNNLAVPLRADSSTGSLRITPKQRWQAAAYSAYFITRNRYSLSLRTARFGSIARFSYSVDTLTNIVMCYQHLIGELRYFLQPLETAESSVLVDVLHFPDRLVQSIGAKDFVGQNLSHSFFADYNAALCSKLIQHSKLLMENKQEELCSRVLVTLCKMSTNSTNHCFNPQAKAVRCRMLERYFGKESIQQYSGTLINLGIDKTVEGTAGSRTNTIIFDTDLCPLENLSLYEAQCKLNNAGAVGLVIDLIVMDPPFSIFLKAVNLAKALLLGGNEEVQLAFYTKLRQKTGATSQFFNVIALKFQSAQNRLKTDMMTGASSRSHTFFLPSSISTSRRSSTAITPISGSANTSFDRETEPQTAPILNQQNDPKTNVFFNAAADSFLSSDTLKQKHHRKTSVRNEHKYSALLKDKITSSLDIDLNSSFSPSQPTIPKLIISSPATNTNQHSDDYQPVENQTKQRRKVSQTGKQIRAALISGGSGSTFLNSPILDDTSKEWSLTDDELNVFLPMEVALVEPILRFLQLLCENHNQTLQNYLRNQHERTNHNLVAETLKFLDTICGSTKGSLGVFAEIGEHNFSLITQTLTTLTEFCQGPCHENQNTLVTHESNGLDIIISLVLNEIRPLADTRMDLALEIKGNAAKLLLAILESRHDADNADRILRNMAQISSGGEGPKQIIRAIVNAFEMASSSEFQVAKVRQQLMQVAQQQHWSQNDDGMDDEKDERENSRSVEQNVRTRPETLNLSPSTDDQNSTVTTSNNPETKRPKKIITTPSSLPSSPINSPQPCVSTKSIADPLEFGHNIYILTYQLSHHPRGIELAKFLGITTRNNENQMEFSPISDTNNTDKHERSILLASIKSEEETSVTDLTNRALAYYKEHTAQIEIVRRDRSMERVIFPIPEICSYLTQETKQNIVINTERDAQGSKIPGFFDRWTELYSEMQWQKKLQERPWLNACTKRRPLWARMGLFLAILLNLMIALEYPFNVRRHPRRTINESNPFVYLSLVVSLFYNYSTWKRWRSFGLSFWSQLGIFATLFSLTLISLALLGTIATVRLIGVVQLLNKSLNLIALTGDLALTQSWAQRISDSSLLYHGAYLLCCLLGLLIHPFIYSLLLLDIVAREDTLKNVIRSVTRNWRSIILTGILAIILVYHFSIIGYVFFQKDFRLEVDKADAQSIRRMLDDDDPADIAQCSRDQCGSNSESHPNIMPWLSWILNALRDDNEFDSNKDVYPNRQDQATANIPESPRHDKADGAEESETILVWSCETLRMCILTTLNWGLRNGGGIGDVLRSVDPLEPNFFWRILYDLTFFIVLIIIVLNLIFGVIIDTFGDLRTEKNEKEDILKNTCFVCGLERGRFDNKSVTFEQHNENEHNLWHYLYFIVWLQIKDETEFTGPESYVSKCIKERNLDWFPRMQAISLKNEQASTADQQKELHDLKEEFHRNQSLIKELTQRLTDFQQVVKESAF